MTWWEAALFGLIQGLTEFLPISSSGHLLLAQHLLGLEADDLTFEVFVHFGTVLSIASVYRARLRRMARNTWAGLIRPTRFATCYRSDEDVRHVAFIVLATIPTGVIYLLFGEQIASAFTAPRLACSMLLVTGAMLLLTRIAGRSPGGDLSPLKSILIGVAQGAAMIPGISRSGATICTALYQRVHREKAADFSFLMAMPVIVGATGIEALKLVQAGAAGEWVPILIGTVVACAAGVVAIRIVLDFVRRSRLDWFAHYCFAAGIAGWFLV